MIKAKLPLLAFLTILVVVSSELIAEPTITQHPSNQTAAVGQTATFSITATSTKTIFYQWYKDETPVSGANSSSYVTPPTTLGDNGSIFYCIVADSSGPVKSNNATLLVGEAPVVTDNPDDLTVTEGDQAIFSISATGTAPLQYQWRKDGVNISGATSATYIINSTTLSDNGTTYSCVVTNDYDIAISNNATLTVNAGVAPVITLQPEDSAVLTGQSATFTISATGSEPIQYQWKKDGVAISGANNSTYVTPQTSLSDDGSVFICEVTNSFGSASSDPATIYVTSATSRVTSNLQVLYEFEDGEGDVIHDVSGNGTAEDINIITPDKVAWTPNGLETFSSTTRKSTVDSKIRTNCIASNEISIEVWIQPEYIPQWGRRIFTYSLSGSYRNFSVIANDDYYEFRLTTTETDLNGLPSIRTSAGTQTLELTHLVYTRDSDGVAKVYVNGNLDTLGNVPGSLSRFKDNYWLAIGSEPLGGLEWRGMHYLASVYNRALTEFEVQHNYTIGTPVDKKPAFTIHPEDQYVIEGESLLLDSYAVSVLPITYQWKKNGVNIPGATDRKLNIANIGELDNGAVFVNTATTSSGTSTSNSAIVYITGVDSRVTDGMKVLYNFREGSGNVINDVSNNGTPLNLNIFSGDAVEWENGGLRINSAPSIVTTNSASKIIAPVKTSNEISVEAWVASSSTSQPTPSRIFTISADENSRNISFGQNNDEYEISLRTTTNNDGVPAFGSSNGTVSISGYDHVVFTKADDGTAKFYINGTERVSGDISGDFSNWNDVYLLSLGNEFGVDQHWEGLINLIAVFDRALNNSEVLRNYNFGPYGVVYQPTNLTLVSNEIGMITFNWSDNSTNEEGFIIERGSGDPISFVQIGTVSKDSTIFTDQNLEDNTIYTYRVKAYNSLGESEYSDELVVKSLISPIAAPSNLSYSLDDTDGYPIIAWQDNSANETNFVIERRTTVSGSSFSIIDTVGQNVNTFKDNSASGMTTYIYKLQAFNDDTISAYSGDLFVEVGTVVGVENLNEIPKNYYLSQNYPNPFNPTTSISFGLPQNSNVKISIYNMLGQEVKSLVSKNFSVGNHTIKFDASELTSGIYIYSILAEGLNGNKFVQHRKMILLK